MKNKGFDIIEMMVVIGVLMLIMAVILFFKDCGGGAGEGQGNGELRFNEVEGLALQDVNIAGEESKDDTFILDDTLILKDRAIYISNSVVTIDHAVQWASAKEKVTLKIYPSAINRDVELLQTALEQKGINVVTEEYP